MPAPPASISQPETPAASAADTPAPPTVPTPTVPPPAVPSPPMPPPPPARNPVLSPEPLRPVLPARDVENYRKQVFAELARMEALRAVIERIDAAQNHPSDDLASTATQFTEVRRKLEAVKPAAVLAPTHDLLMTSCTFAAMASRLAFDAAADSNPDTRQRAASAAAGSLMLFNRACVDLGCGRTPR